MSEKTADKKVIAEKKKASTIHFKKDANASELVNAIKELAFQVLEREKSAAELSIANQELIYQNKEKERRAAELVIANKELAFQVGEREKRAAELVNANAELAYQIKEKEKRTAELIIANKQLALQIKENEQRANELLIAKKELETFTFISSHDLQEPLRKIQTFSNRMLNEEFDSLSEKGKYYVERTKISALHMQTLINDLLIYSRSSDTESKFEKMELEVVVSEVMLSMKEELLENEASVHTQSLGEVHIMPFQFRQLLQNLISNALKFRAPGRKPIIEIRYEMMRYDPLSSNSFQLKCDHCHISIEDNGIGFDPQYKNKMFEMFQRLNEKKDYVGTGIGLTIVKKIVENHHGVVSAFGRQREGSTFHIYIPADQQQR